MNQYEKFIRDKYGLTKEPGIMVGKKFIIFDSKKYIDTAIDGVPYKIGEFQIQTTHNHFLQTVRYRLFSPKYSFIGEIDVMYKHRHGIVVEMSLSNPDELITAENIFRILPLLIWVTENRAVNAIHMSLPEDSSIATADIAQGKQANDPYPNILKLIGYERWESKCQGYLGYYIKVKDA